MSPETLIIKLAGEWYQRSQVESVTSDRVTLTRYNLSDTSEIFALIQQNQAHFTQYDEPWTDKPKYQDPAIFRKSIENHNNPDLYYFLIRNSAGEAVGGCQLNVNKFSISRSATIGYFIAEQHTRKRYASRAVALLIAYATDDLKLQKLTAFVNPENIGSVTTLEHSGFEFSGPDPANPTYHLYTRALPVSNLHGLY